MFARHANRTAASAVFFLRCVHVVNQQWMPHWCQMALFRGQLSAYPQLHHNLSLPQPWIGEGSCVPHACVAYKWPVCAFFLPWWRGYEDRNSITETWKVGLKKKKKLIKFIMCRICQGIESFMSNNLLNPTCRSKFHVFMSIFGWDMGVQSLALSHGINLINLLPTREITADQVVQW